MLAKQCDFGTSKWLLPPKSSTCMEIDLETQGGRVGASFQDLPLLVEPAPALGFRAWGLGFGVEG
jgi:hypothetical protein